MGWEKHLKETHHIIHGKIGFLTGFPPRKNNKIVKDRWCTQFSVNSKLVRHWPFLPTSSIVLWDHVLCQIWVTMATAAHQAQLIGAARMPTVGQPLFGHARDVIDLARPRVEMRCSTMLGHNSLQCSTAVACHHFSPSLTSSSKAIKNRGPIHCHTSHTSITSISCAPCLGGRWLWQGASRNLEKHHSNRWFLLARNYCTHDDTAMPFGKFISLYTHQCKLFLLVNND